MKLEYVGHACAVIEHNGKKLVFDPWLEGPVYWGSWWHFPRAAYDESIFNADYIYISHWHFDHMHTESLEKFNRAAKLLLPKFPVSGLPDPLRQMGFANIHEIENGETFELTPGFRLTSYQIQLQDDSAAVIECDVPGRAPVVVFNLNDAKPLPSTWRRMRRQFPSVDLMLRSHSPAWSYPSAFTFDDPTEAIPLSRDSYMAAFRLAAEKLGAKHAVPFASGVCHLTEDTLFQNSNLVLAEDLRTYFVAHPLKGTELSVLETGGTYTPEGGFEGARTDSVPPALATFVAQERIEQRARVAKVESEIDACGLSSQDFTNYFTAFRRRSRPLWWAVNACWQFTLLSPRGTRSLFYDFGAGRTYEHTRPVGVSVTAHFTIREGILADALTNMTFSNIDVAKRWKVHLAKGEVTRYFLINTAMGLNEAGYLRLNNLFNFRLWRGLIRRNAEIFDYLKMATSMLVKGKGAVVASTVGPSTLHRDKDCAS